MVFATVGKINHRNLKFGLYERPGGVNVVRSGRQKRGHGGRGGDGGGVCKNLSPTPCHQSRIKSRSMIDAGRE